MNTLYLDFEVDYKFWALLPAININFHNPALEIEFLCFGLYLEYVKEEL